VDRKLRIGVLLESESVPNWAYEMLRRIASGAYAEIVVLIKNDAPKPPPSSVWQKMRVGHSRLLFAALRRADRLLFSASPDAFAPMPIGQLLPDVPLIAVRPVQTEFCDSLTDEDVAAIDSYHLDVLIRMGFRILRGKVLECARFGVWSYHHGDNRVNRGGPAGFWEVLLGWPETGSTLQILTDDLDAGLVLSRSSSRTDPVSFRRSRNNLYWKTLSLLPRKLEQLHRLGGEQFMALTKEENAAPSFYSNRLFSAPRNLELARLLPRSFFRYARKKLRQLFYFDQWCLLFAIGRTEGVSTSLRRYSEMLPPKDRFWADPFVLLRNGTYYVFIEEYLYATRKGHIACFILDETGEWTEPKTVLERPYHLSYPFIFEYQGQTYMLPESAKNGTIELYRCVEFPERWEHAAVLMKDVYAVDATLHQVDGLWWMFVNIRENDGASSWDELFLYSSADPLGNTWIPHPANPVVSDVKSARPAGQIFVANKRLYRPSQDGSPGYGKAVKINRIESLTPTEYTEVCVTTIEPNWDPTLTGVHTLNFDGRVTVSDERKRRRR
jgi:hypothetical protein